MTPEESIRSLQEALRLSPDSAPLRRHLADMLLSIGRAADAEKEYRHALQYAPEGASPKIRLARAYDHQNKNSHALAGDPRRLFRVPRRARTA